MKTQKTAHDPAAFFGDRAAAYDHAYDRMDADGYALRSRMEAVLGFVGPGPGDVLDAGMGPGRLCAELQHRGWTVSGVDASAGMVALARARMPAAEERLVCAPIEALPFANASFDAVVATGVLEYADVQGALGELTRVLRSGGRAVVSYPNPAAFYGLWKTRVFYPAVRIVKRALFQQPLELAASPPGVPLDRFRALFGEVGLQLDATEYTSFLPLPTPLELVTPGMSVRLGEQLERRRPRFGPRLATQIVYSARKP